ncbi:MAG: hypothetical protein CVV33_04620, partial [Methanomicrobiales archaeon HGW-Methanomicrobiales-4]
MTEKIRVLYVDDEINLLDLGKLFLERLGDFTVTTASGAAEVIDILKSDSHDVIISDYQMPVMDGIALLKHLKSHGDNTPFILFTGRGREEVVIEALNNGADFYLQKGGELKSQFTELAHKIRSAVSRRRTEKQAKDTERRLYDIINFLPDATFAIDTEGTVITWNRAIEEMTGVPACDMLGKGNYEYAIPFYGERRPMLINRVSISDEKLSQGTYTFIRKEGDSLIAEATISHTPGKNFVLFGKASLLYNGDGNVIGAIESLRDTTEVNQGREALLGSERKIEAMAANIPGVVYRFCVNPDGTFGFDYISERSRQILGLENDHITFFDKFIMGIVPKDREGFLRSIQYAISTKTLWQCDIQYNKPSGETIWISAVSSPIVEKERLIFDGVIFDNTARKQAEEELVQDENHLDTLVTFYQMASVPLKELMDFALQKAVEFSASSIGYLAFVNEDETMLTMYSWSEQAMKECGINKKPLEYPIHSTGLWGEAVRQRRPVITNDYSAPNPLKKGHPKGHVRIIRHMNIPVFDGAHIVMVAGVGNKSSLYNERDVRELTLLMNGLWNVIKQRKAEAELLRKNEELYAINEELSATDEELRSNLEELIRQEQIIRESEEKYRLIFEYSPLGHISFDEKGVIVACNEKIIQIIGSSREELIGLDLLRLSDNKLVSEVQNALNGETGLYEGIYTSVTSKKITPVRGIFAPMNVESGNIPGGIGIFEDITERKRAEDSLNEANKKLRLLTGLTRHDILNKLTAIQGYHYLALEATDMTSNHEYISHAHQAGDRMEAIIGFTREYENFGIASSGWQRI